MNLDPHLHIDTLDEGALLRLRFHHGKANEMGRAHVAELARLVERLEQGPTRALVSWSDRSTASGTRVFSAGADVRERRDWDESSVLLHVRGQRRTLRRLAAAPVFHACVVDGLALGWGTEFALSADYVIAGPYARFGLPETGLGIVPGAGGTAHLAARVGPGHALRMGMTGEVISAREALRIGLVHEVCDSAEVAMDRALELARRATARSHTAVAAYKAAVRTGLGLDDDDRDGLEGRAYEHCVRTGEAARGRQAFDALARGELVPWGPREPFEG
jgi:enoyl-CoA hydratase/carnithine racemase